ISAESRPDCPDGDLDAIEPSIFTPRTKRSTLTPGGGSRSVSGHFPAAGDAAGAVETACPGFVPCPDGFDVPPPQAAATRASTTNTSSRGHRIAHMGEGVLYRPPILRPPVRNLCRMSVPQPALVEEDVVCSVCEQKVMV